jgi:hypothetical protein
MVKRRVWKHQRGSQNLYIEDEQTTQWSREEFKDTIGVVRIFISKTNRQHIFFWSLCCLFVFDIRILTTPVVSSNSSFDYCVVCSSSIYGFLLPLWCLQSLLLIIVLSIPLRYNDSGCPFGVFKLVLWPLCCLFIFGIWILAAPLKQRGSKNPYIEDEQTTQ